MQTRNSLHRVLTLLALLALLSGGPPATAATVVSTQNPSDAISTQDGAGVTRALPTAPLMFIENVGQFKEGTRFRVQRGDRTMWLAEDGIWLTVVENAGRGNQPLPVAPKHGVNLHLTFPGSDPHPRLEPLDRLETRVSYFIGDDPAKWRSDVPVWSGVRYKDLYPGIDLEITSENGQVVQRAVARPGANLNAVRLRIEGADALELDSDNNALHLTTALGSFTLPLLQAIAADGTPLNLNAARPTVSSSLHWATVIAPFSPSSPLNSPLSPQDNPNGLLYSTFLGGGEDDRSYAIAVDGAGYAYVTGSTCSDDFPTTPGAYDETYNGGLYTYAYCEDGFVVKVNADGSGLVYATFLGGSEEADWGRAIAVDGSGNAYVTGVTASSDFPTTPGAYDTVYNSGYYPDDAFVVKVNPNGTDLVYATFLGGGANDRGAGIAVDEAGNAYVTGSTMSSNFPTTSGAFDPTYNPPNPQGENDAFVVKLNAGGTGLYYGTYLGKGADDSGAAIAVDGTGNAYVVGDTNSSNFPTTTGALDTSHNGGHDAFVTKLNPAGSALVYSSFLGGQDSDFGSSIIVNDAGSAYVAGSTNSSGFPTTTGAFDISHNGNMDAFVVKLNSAGSAMSYSTFLGGQDADYCNAISVDEAGSVYMVGNTNSSDFPPVWAFDTTYNGGGRDTFVSKLDAAGAELIYATFLGGGNMDTGKGIAVVEPDNAYVTGYSDSDDFPTTGEAYDTSHNGDDDAFVTKLALITPTSDDVDAWVQTSTLVGAPPAGSGSIPIRYGNSGATTAASVVLTVTLGTGLTYVADTSGLSPAVAGNLYIWNLPDLAFASQEQFALHISIPGDPIGTRYPVTLTLGSAGPEANASDNTAHVEVMAAEQLFLPLTLRNCSP